MDTEEQYQLIDDYLNGELQGTSLDKFKIDLKNSDELQQQVDLHSAIIKQINAYREAELKAMLERETRSEFSHTRIPPKIKLILSIAASLMFLVTIYLYFAPRQAPMNYSLDTENDIEEINTQQKTKPKNKKKHSKDDQLLAANQLTATEQELIIEEDTDFDLMDEIELSSVEISADGVDSESEEFIIERDALLTTRFYSVKNLDPLSNTSYKEKATNETPLNTTNTKSGTKSELKLEDAIPLKKDKQTTKQAEISIPQGRKINVEYWKSVVNFKGYTYDGTKIQLYGIPENKSLILKELDDRIYLKLDDKHYFIEKIQTYKRFSEVTNPTLLNILND